MLLSTVMIHSIDGHLNLVMTILVNCILTSYFTLHIDVSCVHLVIHCSGLSHFIFDTSTFYEDCSLDMHIVEGYWVEFMLHIVWIWTFVLICDMLFVIVSELLQSGIQSIPRLLPALSSDWSIMYNLACDAIVCIVCDVLMFISVWRTLES